MRILTTEEYRERILPHLSDCGAFLRISRKEGLFVTDAPARMKCAKALKEALSEEFHSVIIGKCMYITPDFHTDTAASNEILEILKSEPQKRNVLIRQSLAKAMRNKDEINKAIFEELLKGENKSC